MKYPNRRPKTRSKNCGFENMTPEKLKAAQEKGRQVKIENNKKRKALREELEILLSIGDTQERMSAMLIQKCLSGGKDAIQAYTTIRDTIGEKISDKVELSAPNVINITIEDDTES